MRFGKIQYLNLLPFDVFLKSYPAPSRFKSAAFARKSYPSKLNQSFFFRRIDAGFISTIAGYRASLNHRATKSGIIAKGDVWSVIVIPHDDDKANAEKKDSPNLSKKAESKKQASHISHSNTASTANIENITNHANAAKSTKDYQSDTSNALSDVLGLNGSVLIGDRALLYRYQGGAHIDMGKAWFDKHRLPFVFGRLCFNRYEALYTRISSLFNARHIKIPQYILEKYAKETQIPKKYILEYLTHIYYKIDKKESISISRFYRALRLKRVRFASRNYPKNMQKNPKINSNKIG
ncbi:hypothetical protein BKN38_09185 [Helicobacter sp. CLO-3]|uniref:MqnA/MqnD/SBP family protein n=1 Tax=unclassified Helicobacter TaxID=2593540 RepID=UPI0008048351|nr:MULTISPECIES: MqnA/MqnD/SBP family protein [unclassified Helicobacter]OBV28743.1 hypothetical protein BA723_08275 [Helicobacter sp. CLO-3]OHU81395.1 hypothetical protein BKN38_09185 [Helicobacter sp. CLO-3]